MNGRSIPRFATLVLMLVALTGCGRTGAASSPDDVVAEDPRPVATRVDLAENRPQVILPTGDVIEVEVSADDVSRAQGLMFRENLPEGKGMIFLFADESPHAFWMKNTVIFLDIVWIDSALKIVHIERMVEPCTGDPCPSYPPSAPALYVLELAGGEVDRFGLQTGDSLELRNLDDVAAR